MAVYTSKNQKLEPGAEGVRIMGTRDGHYGLADYSHLVRPEFRQIYTEAYEAARAE